MRTQQLPYFVIAREVASYELMKAVAMKTATEMTEKQRRAMEALEDARG